MNRAQALRLWSDGGKGHEPDHEASGAAGGDGDEDGSRRLTISPQRFHELMRCSRISSAPVRAVVYPQITPSPRRMTLRRLTPAEAGEHWRRGLFRAGRPRVLGGVFVFSPATRTVGQEDASVPAEVDPGVGDWASHHLPMWHCNLGGDEVLDASEVRGLLQLRAP
jgi:hypothetical protein